MHPFSWRDGAFAAAAAIVTAVSCAACSGPRTVVPTAEAQRRPPPSLFSNLARSTSSLGTLKATLAYESPGLASQGITSQASGSIAPSDHAGSLALQSQGLPIAQLTFLPSAIYVSSATVLPGLSGPSAIAVPLLQARAAGTANPADAYLAIISDPLLWLDLLRGVSSASPAITAAGAHGTKSVRYDVVYDLSSAANSAPAPDARALRWLATYTGTTKLPGRIWIARSGALARMSLLRVPPGWVPPARGGYFSALAAGANQLVLALSAPSRARHITSATPPAEAINLATTAPGSRCLPAGGTGYTAAVIAKPNQVITGNVQAAGCNIGIYIGPDASGASVLSASVTGASDHAIFVQNANRVTIRNVTASLAVTRLSAIRHALLPQDKAIVLIGTTGSKVVGSTLTGSFDGGVAISDDGIIDPAALNPGPPKSSRHDLIAGNRIASVGGCGIVVTSFVPGQGVYDNSVADNNVVNSAPGGIGIGAVSPHTTARGNVIAGNEIIGTASGTSAPGVIVHSNARGAAVEANTITRNVITNGQSVLPYGDASATGIVLVGIVDPVVGTVISGNVLSGETVGVYAARATRTRITGESPPAFAGGPYNVTVRTPKVDFSILGDG